MEKNGIPAAGMPEVAIPAVAAVPAAGVPENGVPENGYPVTGLPLGFGMALAMNEAAMQRYAGLTESEKEAIIMKCRDAASKEEMRKIVDSLVPDQNPHSLFEGPKTT